MLFFPYFVEKRRFLMTPEELRGYVDQLENCAQCIYDLVAEMRAGTGPHDPYAIPVVPTTAQGGVTLS